MKRFYTNFISDNSFGRHVEIQSNALGLAQRYQYAENQVHRDIITQQ